MSAGIANAMGPYLHANGAKRTISFDVNGAPRAYTVLIAGAFNACGLIGSEHNGLVILDETLKRVLLDRDTPTDSGYHGPNESQWARFESICKADWDGFRAIVNANARARYTLAPDGSEAAARSAPGASPVPAKRAPAKGKRFDWNAPVAYDADAKRSFHATARRRLLTLAAELGLPSGSFDVRSNMGGIAVSGEVTLHGDSLYVQASQSCGSNTLLIRACKGRRDYSGGPNGFLPLDSLNNIPALARAIKARKLAPSPYALRNGALGD